MKTRPVNLVYGRLTNDKVTSEDITLRGVITGCWCQLHIIGMVLFYYYLLLALLTSLFYLSYVQSVVNHKPYTGT